MKTIEEKAEAYRLMIESDEYEAGRTTAQKLVDGIEAMKAYYAGYKEAEPKWISVDDKPDKSGCYIAALDNDIILIATWHSENSGSIASGTWRDRYRLGRIKVTHWMPLPKLPKGEE